LSAINTGAVHVQVTHFTLMPLNDPTPPVEHQSPQYVFPGQRGDWQIELKPFPATGSSLHVSAGTDAGPVEADIIVETP
jgi:P pilus assembly chaperone PapD